MELKHIARRSGRLSSFLKEEMAMSTGLMNRLKWRDQLFVNGIAVHTDYAVQPGDVITVPLDESEADYPAQDGRLEILYEDEHLLAVEALCKSDDPSAQVSLPNGLVARRVYDRLELVRVEPVQAWEETTLLLPGEAHQPCMKAKSGYARKMVIKIPADKLKAPMTV